MNLNFKGAFEALGVDPSKGEGVCYLRYDDTNPESESQEYIDSIRNSVEWMGWSPWKITFSSDYFDELHALAIKLIEKGKVTVDL